MAQAAAQIETKHDTLNGVRVAVVAWLVTAVFYFYQYSIRSSPAVMMPQLSDALRSQRVGRGFDSRSFLLRLFTFQSGGRRGHGSNGAAPACCRLPPAWSA